MNENLQTQVSLRSRFYYVKLIAVVITVVSLFAASFWIYLKKNSIKFSSEDQQKITGNQQPSTEPLPTMPVRDGNSTMLAYPTIVESMVMSSPKLINRMNSETFTPIKCAQVFDKNYDRVSEPIEVEGLYGDILWLKSAYEDLELRKYQVTRKILLSQNPDVYQDISGEITGSTHIYDVCTTDNSTYILYTMAFNFGDLQPISLNLDRIAYAGGPSQFYRQYLLTRTDTGLTYYSFNSTHDLPLKMNLLSSQTLTDSGHSLKRRPDMFSPDRIKGLLGDKLLIFGKTYCEYECRDNPMTVSLFEVDLAKQEMTEISMCHLDHSYEGAKTKCYDTNGKYVEYNPSESDNY